MFTVILSLVAISILIFVHELGHFLAAKRAGMKVDEFGFGFPPRIWSFRYRGTIYSINSIPFGGFVKILGESGDRSSDPQSFTAKPIRFRMQVVLAGVAMNFLLAALLLMLSNGFGLRIGLPDAYHIGNARDVHVQVLEVMPGSPAEEAGLEPLDALVQLTFQDGLTKSVYDPEQVQELVNLHAGERIEITAERGNREILLSVATRAHPPVGQGPIGISMALTGVVSYPWYEAIWRGVYDAILMTWNTVRGFVFLIGTLLVKQQLIADISGPVGIIKLAGQAAHVGLSYLAQFVALISINLMVLNAIPFPALDGGRAILLILEKFRGKPIGRHIEAGINMAGFAILIGLMIFITVKDVARLF